MPNPEGGSTSRLAQKINHLFTEVVPAGRGPYTTEEVARAITAAGAPISGSYIWLLRKDSATTPPSGTWRVWPDSSESRPRTSSTTR